MASQEKEEEGKEKAIIGLANDSPAALWSSAGALGKIRAQIERARNFDAVASKLRLLPEGTSVGEDDFPDIMMQVNSGGGGGATSTKVATPTGGSNVVTIATSNDATAAEPAEPRPAAKGKADGWVAGKYRVVFLDVDGVLHPLGPDALPSEANRRDILARAEAEGLEEDEDEDEDEDEERGKKSNRGRVARVVRGEFLPRCLEQLRRIVVEGGGGHNNNKKNGNKSEKVLLVLSSTWRETAPQRRAVDAQLRGADLPPCAGATPTASDLYAGMDDDDDDDDDDDGSVAASVLGGRKYNNKNNKNNKNNNRRAAEIAVWLAANESAVSSFVVLDDQDLCERTSGGAGGGGHGGGGRGGDDSEHRDLAAEAIRPFFVRVNAATGLTAAESDEAIRLLRAGS